MFNDCGVNRQWIAEIDFLGSLSSVKLILLCQIYEHWCVICVSWFELRNLLDIHLAVVSLSLLTSTRPTLMHLYCNIPLFNMERGKWYQLLHCHE